MIAFDTNIAIYFLNGHPQFSEQSGSIINQAKAHGGCLSVLLVSELLCLNSFNEQNSLNCAENFIESLFPIGFIPIDDSIARYAAFLRRNNRSLKLPDAIHLASATLGGATEFWTNDHRLASLKLDRLEIKLLQDAYIC